MSQKRHNVDQIISKLRQPSEPWGPGEPKWAVPGGSEPPTRPLCHSSMDYSVGFTSSSIRSIRGVSASIISEFIWA